MSSWLDTFFHNDTTKRSKDAAKLLELNEYLTAFQNLGTAILVGDLLTNRVVEANEAAYRLFELPREEIIGRNPRTMQPDEFKQNFLDTFKSFQRSGMSSINLEAPILTSKGERVPTLMTMKVYRQGLRPYVICSFFDLRSVPSYSAVKNDRYRLLAEQSPDMLIELDLEGKILYVNSAPFTILKMPSIDLVGKDFFSYIHPDDLSSARELFKDATPIDVLEKKPSRQLRMHRVDGIYVYVDVLGGAVRDEKGVAQSVIMTCRDVTIQVLAEQRLQANETRYHQLFNTMQNGVVVFETKDDGATFVVKSINSAVEKLEKVTQREMIGKSLDKILFGSKEFGLGSTILNVWKTGKAKHVPPATTQTPAATIWRDVNVYKLHSGEVVLVYQDVSEQIRFELALAESSKRMEQERNISLRLAEDLNKFKLAVDSASDLIVITDPTDRIVYANPATERITGFTMDVILQHTADDLWAKEADANQTAAMKKKVRNEKKAYIGEATYRRTDDSAYIAEVQAAPLLDEKGEIAFVVYIERDITRAKEIDRMKTEFVSMASHQLRTPLTGIRWFIELLLDNDKNLTKEQKEFTKEIDENNQRMIRLVSDLLNVSRIETGTKFVITKQKGNIREALETSIRNTKGYAESRKISVVLSEKTPEVLQAEYDADKVMLILQNLIENAVKYSPEGSQVELGCDVEKDVVECYVKDHGIGIPLNQRHRIFERFFRAENAQLSSAVGTGLGLYIAKSIAEGHGGKIWFDSELNKGTTFYFTLPKTEEKKQEAK